MKKTITTVLALFLIAPIFAQKKQDFKLVSPNGKIEVTISLSDKITWTITHEKGTVLSASSMSMTLNGVEILGKNPILLNSKKKVFTLHLKLHFTKRNQFKTITINYC
jgi:alpha-glucosidase